MPRPALLSRRAIARRLTYVMLVRVLLYTLLLGGTVGLHIISGRPGQLGGPYVTVLFVFVAVIYVLNIGYALLMRFLGELRLFAAAQIGVDLLTSAALVHFTGGANSPFLFFFLLSPIATPLVFPRRAALLTAGAGAAVLAAVTALGYYAMLPPLPGQSELPSAVTSTELLRTMLLYGGATVAIAVLVSYLAEQVNVQVEEQQAHIEDLAQLNEDIIRCLASGLITVDSDGFVLTINDAAAEMLALGGEPALGRPLSAVASELAPFVAADAAPIQRVEVTMQRRDKLLFLGVSSSWLTDHLNSRVGRIITFQNLTALRQMETMMRRSEHLAGIGRLAAGIAHEIRNPLASISGSLELLRDEEALDTDTRKLLGISLREIERLDGLIVDLLSFARPREPRLEPVDIGREIHVLAEGISGLLAQDSAPAVRVAESQEDLWIEGDRDQLRGILWNLVRNAWQAGESDEVVLRVIPSGRSSVRIEVTDHGSGIDADDLPHLFEPFFTTKAKGTGLGLALVLRSIEDHRGHVDVSSRPGAGTTFAISLPRMDTPPERRPLPAAQRSS